MEDWVNLSRNAMRRKKSEKEYGLIGEGLCCRLRDLGVLFVWLMYLQRPSWPIKSCGTFASRKASPNVSFPCGLNYFLLRSTSLTKSSRLVAVAPEPVKQDLIDNEFLESVPKTMKAKDKPQLPTGLLFLVWFASSYPRCPWLSHVVPLEVLGALESDGIYLLRSVPSLK
jgi:hypothetical protein